MNTLQRFLTILITLGLLVALPVAVEAFTPSQTSNGGTGTSTPSGILYGDNGATGHLNTVTVGSNLTFSGGTLSATGGGGTGLSTTSPVSGGNLLEYSAVGAGSAFGVATTSPTLGLGLSYSGTLGAFVGGAAGQLTIATSSLYSGSTGQFPYFSAANTLTATSSLFLATSGNVGIGTTTPTAPLNIQALVDSAPAFKVSKQLNGQTQFSINDNGTVGITDGAKLYLDSATGGGITYLQEVSGVQLVGGAGRNVIFSAGTGEVFRASSNGFVGVGTTSPYANLSVMVGGSSQSYASQAASTVFAVGSSTAGTATSTLFSVNSSGSAVINANANLSGNILDVQLAGTSKLFVRQDGVITGTNDFRAGSMTMTTSGLRMGNQAATMQLGYSSVNGSAGPEIDLIGPTVAIDPGVIAFRTGPATAAQNPEVARFDAAGNLGIGTTSPKWNLTISSSTASQLTLTDASASANPWSFRSINSNLYLSTSSPSTFATSSNSVLSIISNSTSNATTTFSLTDWVLKQTSAVAFRIQDAFGTDVVRVNTASTTGPSLDVVASTTSNAQIDAGTAIHLFTVDQYGHLMASSTPSTPVVSSCGTNPSVSSGSTDSVGAVTTGTASPTACTITFGRAFVTAPAVFLEDTSTGVTVDISAVSTTAFTISMSAALNSTKIYWFAIQGPATL